MTFQILRKKNSRNTLICAFPHKNSRDILTFLFVLKNSINTLTFQILLKNSRNTWIDRHWCSSQLSHQHRAQSRPQPCWPPSTCPPVHWIYRNYILNIHKEVSEVPPAVQPIVLRMLDIFRLKCLSLNVMQVLNITHQRHKMFVARKVWLWENFVANLWTFLA